LIDEALDLPELPPNDSSQDVSGDMLFWDDFLPTQLPEEDNSWSGDLEEDMNVSDELDLACQVDPAEVAENIVSNISQTSRSSWDSGADDRDNGEFMPYVSAPLESESCTWMVSLAWLPHCFMNIHHSCSRIYHAECPMKISSPLIIIWKHLILVSSTKTTILCYSSSIEITGLSAGLEDVHVPAVSTQNWKQIVLLFWWCACVYVFVCVCDAIWP
jgi:hypothetical protein